MRARGIFSFFLAQKADQQQHNSSKQQLTATYLRVLPGETDSLQGAQSYVWSASDVGQWGAPEPPELLCAADGVCVC